MIEHKKWVQNVFDQASSEYGKGGCGFFDYFGERLVEFAPPSTGDQILDIAIGKGAVLFPAARLVGPQGTAIGIDLSQKMIEESTKKNSYAWVKLHQMDAENLLFPAQSFDVVYCAFALFFFTQVAQVISECKRILKPRGRFAISIFSKQAALDGWICDKVKEYGVTSQLTTVASDRVPALLKLLAEAGIIVCETFEESQTFWHESAEEWWDSIWTHALRSKLEPLTTKDLEKLKREALIRAGNGRVSEERTAFYVIANQPTL